jgi:drug/metabolite transporter (DMT)-like permease
LLVAQPVIAALLGIRLGQHPTRETWISIALSLVGLTIIAGGDFALGPRALLGDLMCILGDLAIALFYVVTHEERRELPLSSFMAVTLLFGALVELPLVLASGARLGGYPSEAYGWLLALILVTTMGGHGLMNVAARQVRLFTLNVVIVLEPPIGILIGAGLFGARVTALQIAGGVLLAAAVVIGLRQERS